MGKKSRERMTDLTEEGRVKRSVQRKTKEEEERKKRELEAARTVASAILGRPIFPGILGVPSVSIKSKGTPDTVKFVGAKKHERKDAET